MAPNSLLLLAQPTFRRCCRVYKQLMLQLARDVQAILEEEGRSALQSGWAELRLEEGDVGPSLHLEPLKLEAAPLELYFDSSELIVCSPGRNGIVVEFFSEDPGDIRERARALIAAVAAGRYRERMSDDEGEIVAEWPGLEGPEQARRSAIGGSPSDPQAWRSVDYEPY